MKTLPFIALLALAASASTAADDRPRRPLEVSDLTFEIQPPSGNLEIRSAKGRSDVGVDRKRLSESSGLEPGTADGSVDFAIVAEAGRTDCRGSRRGDKVTGTCRFVSEAAFEVGLAQRGVALERRRDLLALALVDARLALVDDLSRQGFPPETSGNLIAATALGVTGGWAREIREAELRVDDFEELVAARALGIDGAYLRAMAAAGFPRLTASQVTAMKAVGVTPEYAATMSRAAGAAQVLAAAEHLQ